MAQAKQTRTVKTLENYVADLAAEEARHAERKSIINASINRCKLDRIKKLDPALVDKLIAAAEAEVA